MNFHGEKRSNQTQKPKSDPEAQWARQGAGKEAKLSYSGNLLAENRHGLLVSSRVWEATGIAERYAVLERLQEIPGIGCVMGGRGDKGFDTADFVRECRNLRMTPHVAQNPRRRQCHRWAHHATPGLPGQPEEEEAHRRMLWLAEDDCFVAQGASSR
ncbi:MAG TPA: hypothetical protein VNE63_18675, partial [Candidatus Acidoferrales bacterium]|nr:hypothetical protein [Candidatus Acidoferrales bacterium]